MAVPKRKKSRSRTRSRRAQWTAAPVPLVPVRVDGEECLLPLALHKAARRGLLR